MSERDRPKQSLPRRRHRRVVRPATGGDPERSLEGVDGVSEQDPPESAWAGEGGAADPAARRAGRERWWQEQRPPHWE